MNDIKDALTKVADSSAPAPLALEHVRGRARQIRRRRTATAIVGSAAAVAAIAGLGIAVMPSGSHDDGKPPVATQTPDPSPSVAADPNAVGPVHHVQLDVPAEQTFNNEPRVPYWSDGQIIDTDGSATPFADRPFTFAKDPATGDWMVIYPGEANALLVRVTDDGAQLGAPVPSFEHGLAIGPRGELATVTQDNSRRILTEGDRVVDIGAGSEWPEIRGILPNGDVLFQGPRSLMVAHMDTDQVEPVTDGLTAVTSPPTGLVAYAQDNGTWKAVDPSGATHWSLDWAGVNSFSPDGRYVALVGDPQTRIPGSAYWDSPNATSTIWIRTAADLLPVAAFVAPDGGYFWNWTWDGDELLATVFLKGEWSLVRLSADGVTVGRAMTQPGTGEEPTYVFAAQ